MIAYKIKIVLRDSNPLIWRRIIIPSQITFERLHDIIQVAMGWSNNFLYDFNIVEENLRITCDEENIDRYNFYSKIKLTEDNDPYGYIAKYTKIIPKRSNEVIIDDYFIKYNQIEYVYDFGDYWKHDLIIEEVLKDYKGPCPVCIGGEEACPPEDIGGILEYGQFLRIINDENHQDYESLRKWATENFYKEAFSVDDVNNYMESKFIINKF